MATQGTSEARNHTNSVVSAISEARSQANTVVAGTSEIPGLISILFEQVNWLQKDPAIHNRLPDPGPWVEGPAAVAKPLQFVTIELSLISRLRRFYGC